jgi:hypothetical protein
VSTVTAANTTTDRMRGPGAVRECLDQAHEHVAAAQRDLPARVPDPAELHAAIDGALRISTALADLVAAVMRQAPASLDHSSGPMLHELLADLHAIHGCLTTGAVLLAPGRDDLRHLVTRPITNRSTSQVTTQEGGPAMPDHTLNDTLDGVLDDAAPANDVADQQRPARPEPVDDERDEEQDLGGVGEVLDADPADVADQRRDAPVLDETEPWP